MTDERRAISDLSAADLAAWLLERGEPRYRARQIRRQLTHGTARGFDELTDLPIRLREALAAAFRWTTVEPVREEASADGETRKALLELRDGHHIETVLMRATRCASRPRRDVRWRARSAPRERWVWSGT